MSVDTRLPFSWSSIPKERSTLNFGSSSSFLGFKRESEAAKQKKHLFKVQTIKANKTFVVSVTKNSHFHSPVFVQHDSMGLKGAPAAAAATVTLSSSDDVVLKSPNDSRLYRLIHLENGLQALLVHDPEIYPEGPPKTDAMDEDEEEEDDDDDDEEDEEDGMDEDDDEEDEDEEEGSEDELEGREGGKGAANQSKKVVFFMLFLC
jgi:nardilysin